METTLKNLNFRGFFKILWVLLPWCHQQSSVIWGSVITLHLRAPTFRLLLTRGYMALNSEEAYKNQVESETNITSPASP